MKLNDRNVNNTEPIELKRLQNDSHEKSINRFIGFRKFSIINFLFFAFISIMFCMNPLVSEFMVIPSTISLTFSLSIIVFEMFVKDTLIKKRIFNSLIDIHISEEKERELERIGF
jgi:hypothetical protein